MWVGLEHLPCKLFILMIAKRLIISLVLIKIQVDVESLCCRIVC